MDFLPEHISRMMAALPIKNERRRALLPCILREWGHEYLDQHLALKNPAAMREESKRFNEIAKRADALASGLVDLGAIQRFALGYQFSELETPLRRGRDRDLT